MRGLIAEFIISSLLTVSVLQVHPALTINMPESDHTGEHESNIIDKATPAERRI